MEIWQQVKDFEDYEISDQGRLRRGESIITPAIRKNGHKAVTLSKGSTRKTAHIHSLVAKMFLLGGKELRPKTCVIFVDKDRSNTTLNNLRVVTYSERTMHSQALEPDVEDAAREILKLLYTQNGSRPLSAAAMKKMLNIPTRIIRELAEEEGILLTRRQEIKLYEYDGDQGTLGHFANKYEISYQTLYTRVIRLKWGLEQAITTPVLRHEIQGND